MPGFALGAEETLSEDAVLGFEMSNACFEVGLALFGGEERGAIVSGLLARLEELGKIGTVRTRKAGKRTKEVRLGRRLGEWSR